MPSLPSEDEPDRIAEAVSALDLNYIVITSVTRDDLPDGGASLFAKTIKVVKERKPGAKVEVLIPDFQGSEEALDKVIQAEPDVINHNIEAVEAIYPEINRPIENYQRSLTVLKILKMKGAVTKSGLMLGLGERRKEIIQTFSDLRSAGCDFLTIGQYLQPTRLNVLLKKYYSPLEFYQLKNIALDFGIFNVEAGPLVRSSFGAYKMYQSLQTREH